jgi:hypothetical protein
MAAKMTALLFSVQFAENITTITITITSITYVYTVISSSSISSTEHDRSIHGLSQFCGSFTASRINEINKCLFPVNPLCHMSSFLLRLIIIYYFILQNCCRNDENTQNRILK